MCRQQMGGRDGAISRKSSELDSFVGRGGGTVSRLDHRGSWHWPRADGSAPLRGRSSSVRQGGLCCGGPLSGDLQAIMCHLPGLDSRFEAVGSGCEVVVEEKEGKCCSGAGAAAQPTAAACIQRGSLPLKLGGTWDLGPGTRSSASPRARHDFRLVDPSSIKVPIEVGQVKEQHNTRSGRGPTRTGVPAVVFVVTRSLPASPQARRWSQPLVDGAISTKHWATTWRQAAAASPTDASAMSHCCIPHAGEHLPRAL